MFARLFAIIALFPVLAFSQTEIPFNGSKNTIEYKQAGNSFTWTPVTGETPRSAQPYRPDLSGGAASTVEPKVKWTPQLPYEHKGGTSAKATIHWPVDPNKVSAAASKAAGAAAAGAATGNGYVALSMVACAFVCEPLIAALVDWGAEQFKLQPDGSLSVEYLDTNAPLSDGYEYSTGYGWFYSRDAACMSYKPALDAIYGRDLPFLRSGDDYCVFRLFSDNDSFGNIKKRTSSCPAGSAFTSDGVCTSKPVTDQSLSEYLNSNYTGKGWDHHWAGITAALVAAGHNVFTDGTGTTISGPANVPLSQSTTQNPVNVVPGTTTPAPPGHTGPTDSGTITTTTTQTANNTFRPGSSSSGPSMQTSTQTSVSTTITNNVTNNTSTSVVNQTTETDEAPKEKDEDFCKKNPDSLACAELDTPEGEIPRDKIEIDFEPEDLGLGSGSCPPDKPIDDIHVFSYQPTCEILDTYGYWLTIALSTFGALLIIFVGKADA